MKKITIALIGMGRIGRHHAEVLLKEVPDVAVKYGIDPLLNEDMKKWAKTVGIPLLEKDPANALADPKVDAVYICCTTDYHSENIVKAARAGKNIFCEKPLDMDLARLRGALSEVKRAGVKFQTGFHRRFDHNHSAMRAAIDSGKVGSPEMVKIFSCDTFIQPIEYLRSSGGVFFDMMIHDFDMARFLAGSDVAEVYALGGVLIDERFKEIPDIDTAIVTLKFANGVVGVITNSRECRFGHDQRTEVLCSTGTVQTQNDAPNRLVISTEQGITTTCPYDFFLNRYMGAYIAENKSFIDALRNDTPTVVGIHDGVEPIRIATACNKSLAENRPVRLDEIDTAEC